MSAYNVTVLVAERVGRMFYLVEPSSTYFTDIAQVPDYITEAIPFFILSVILESILMAFDDDLRPARVNDGIGSMAAGLFQQMFNKILLKGLEIKSFIWCYERFRLWDLSTDSLWTFVAAFIFIDLGYYWFHRMAHEINIFWAGHVVHHSSEEYNQTTALRQSVLQVYTSWMFYLPFAVCLPPPIFLAHKQFNTLYQFWIHTEMVGKLGPLEWVLNTPSHHRVHHGRNPYCIDKNYAGTLIVWDRLFGTFEAEHDDERVVYGITHPLGTFDPVTIQFAHLNHILRTAAATPGSFNKLAVFWKGPGWAPGKPRLGLLADIPKVTYPEKLYDPPVPGSVSFYCVIQFLVALVAYLNTVGDKAPITTVMTFFSFSYILLALTAIGAIFDRKSWALPLEIARQLLTIGICWAIGEGHLTVKLALFSKLGVQAEALQVILVIAALSLLFVVLRAALVGFLGKDGPVWRQNPRALAKLAKDKKKQ